MKKSDAMQCKAYTERIECMGNGKSSVQLATIASIEIIVCFFSPSLFFHSNTGVKRCPSLNKSPCINCLFFCRENFLLIVFFRHITIRSFFIDFIKRNRFSSLRCIEWMHFFRFYFFWDEQIIIGSRLFMRMHLNIVWCIDPLLVNELNWENARNMPERCRVKHFVRFIQAISFYSINQKCETGTGTLNDFIL